MTPAQAATYVVPENHAEYVRLGGQLDATAYAAVATQWVALTFDAYVCGNGSRVVASEAFEHWLLDTHPDEDAAVIFASIDNIHPYT